MSHSLEQVFSKQDAGNGEWFWFCFGFLNLKAGRANSIQEALCNNTLMDYISRKKRWSAESKFYHLRKRQFTIHAYILQRKEGVFQSHCLFSRTKHEKQTLPTPWKNKKYNPLCSRNIFDQTSLNPFTMMLFSHHRLLVSFTLLTLEDSSLVFIYLPKGRLLSIALLGSHQQNYIWD